MAEKSARWVDELFPRVAVRQWVLTVPWKRRWDLARSQLWVRGVLKILVRRVQRHYRRRLKLPQSETGSVTVVQRFGSALNLNVHFHVLMLDGLFAERDGRMRFRRLPFTGGRGERSASETGSATWWQGLQAAAPSASFHGYNLHGNTVVAAKRRDELERLCRYVLRPPFSKERLEMRPDGHLRYTLKGGWFIPSTVPPEIASKDPDAVGSIISTDKAPRAGLNGKRHHLVVVHARAVRRVGTAARPVASPRAVVVSVCRSVSRGSVGYGSHGAVGYGSHGAVGYGGRSA
jgi:hypothetical protein